MCSYLANKQYYGLAQVLSSDVNMYLFDASYEDIMISYSDTRAIWISLDASVRVTCLNFCHLCLQEVLLWRKPVIKKKLSDKTMINSTCKHSWKAVWVIRSSVYSTVWPHTYSRWHCRPWGVGWGGRHTHTATTVLWHCLAKYSILTYRSCEVKWANWM